MDQQHIVNENDEIVINDFINKFEHLDLNCTGRVGEDVVDLRIQQLTYAKLLSQVYQRDQYYLIKSYTQLGQAYLDIEYFEQAQEHLLTAYRLNSRVNDEMNIKAKEYEINISIALAKCYLETNKLSAAVSICEKCLSINKSLYGEGHISNAEIYYIFAKVYTLLTP
jgi:tetratricopeptide (TPR) repeat protein